MILLTFAPTVEYGCRFGDLIGEPLQFVDYVGRVAFCFEHGLVVCDDQQRGVGTGHFP